MHPIPCRGQSHSRQKASRFRQQALAHGKLADCCARRGPEEDTLRAAGLISGDAGHLASDVSRSVSIT
jgi:hypothetical protein